MLVVLISLWAIVFHSKKSDFRSREKELARWLLLCIGLGAPYLLIHHGSRLELAIRSLLERLTLLSYLYVCMELLSTIVILLRSTPRAVVGVRAWIDAAF
jgi:hypothetical protein